MTSSLVVKRIAFTTPPMPGVALMVEGQRFVVSRTCLHRRQDGEFTTLITWVGHCAQCGCEFEQDSGLVSKGINRRCRDHRQPGVPVTIAGTSRRLRQLRSALSKQTKR